MEIKNKVNAIMDTAEDSTNKIFGLSPLTKDKRPFLTKLRVTWYFDTWISKGFLLFLLLGTIYAIIRIILQGWW